MGIRFYCPNGHKLNVKDFQAGRKGICPVCGVKMQIPLESTRPSSREEESQSQGGMPETPIATPESIVAPPPTVVAPATPPPAPAPVDGTGDPLAEAGNLVWYVRPSSGGQFGPAPADLMRTWLAEGHVNADALVWREGWRDWREADNVFSQLSRRQTIPGLENILPEPVASPVGSHPYNRRARARNKSLIAVGALVLTVFILFGVLLWVLFQQ